MSTKGGFEKVLMFRCVQDPMVGPKPRNAFMLPDLPGWEAWYHLQTSSVHVTTDKGRRHVIPTGNLSSVELFKEETHGTIQDAAGAGSQTIEAQRKKPGRPRLEPSQGI